MTELIGRGFPAQTPQRLRNVELTDTPTAPTAPAGTDTTQIATTEFVLDATWGSSPIMGTRLFGCANIAQNTTTYIGELGVNNSATEQYMYFYTNRPTRVRDLLVYANALLPASQTATFTWRKNGADTSLTAQCTDSDQYPEDMTNYFDFGPGDYVSLKCVTSATTGSTIDYTISTRFVDPLTNEGVSLFGFNILSGNTAGTTVPGINVSNNSSDNDGAFPIVDDGVYVDGYLAGFAGFSPLVDLKVGGSIKVHVDQNAYSVGNEGLRTFANSSYYLTEINNPVIVPQYSYFTPVINGGDEVLGVFSMKRKTGSGESPYMPLFMTSSSHPQATTRYMTGHGATGQATETVCPVRLMPGKLRGFMLLNTSTGVAGQTWTLNFRKNTVTVLTLVISDTDTYATDLSTTLDVLADDLWTAELTSSATTGTRTMHFAFNHEPS